MTPSLSCKEMVVLGVVMRTMSGGPVQGAVPAGSGEDLFGYPGETGGGRRET
jgi:hypothetical protein